MRGDNYVMAKNFIFDFNGRVEMHVPHDGPQIVRCDHKAPTPEPEDYPIPEPAPVPLEEPVPDHNPEVAMTSQSL